MEWIKYISPYAKVVFEYFIKRNTQSIRDTVPRLVEITTSGSIFDFYDVQLFNANTNRFLPNYGNPANVTVTALLADTYLELLANTMPNPFAIGKLRAEFYNLDGTPYHFTYYTGFTFFTAAPIGEAAQESIPLIKSIIQTQRTTIEVEIEENEMMWIEGDSGLNITVRGQSLVKLYLYPRVVTSIRELLARGIFYKEIDGAIIEKRLKDYKPKGDVGFTI